MIKALVFDLDGTIIDTEEITFESYKQAFQYYDFELTLDVWEKWVGAVGTPQKVCKYVAEQTGKEIDFQKIQQLQDEVFSQLITDKEPLPGVIDMLEAGKKADLKIGLATNSGSKWANHFLTMLKIKDYFDNVYTFDHIKQPKPDPEIYVKSIQHFNVAPREAIAFEDSVVGSIAAKRAELHTIVVPSKLTKKATFDHADLKIDSMAKLDLPTLINELSSKVVYESIS
ncbi:HAD family hydrolase [Pseudogracilibacillus auburnensis]|uniref:Putative hydrolase of the HAD superfamily n=1 Tax=Pseudogracilibacillus auburnensis TaxID=1494959 RepID=A0A2V3W2F0_9BACI|nr:HAD family phosphatase [Pseudogracilibacillus auburnensis]PXW88080.1 putative hydrolase of the HAD superfamily [Pseudogracilibacillus auburnensis]